MILNSSQYRQQGQSPDEAEEDGQEEDCQLAHMLALHISAHLGVTDTQSGDASFFEGPWMDPGDVVDLTPAFSVLDRTVLRPCGKDDPPGLDILHSVMFS